MPPLFQGSEFFWRQTHIILEKPGKAIAVLISYRPCDLFYLHIRLVQQMLGPLQTQAVNIFLKIASAFFLEQIAQIARRHAAVLGHVRKRESAGLIIFIDK